MNLNDFTQIPYRKRGRGLDGLDCYGLVVLYFKGMLDLDLLDYPVTHGTDDENAELFIGSAYVDWKPVQDWRQARQHDVVLLLTPSGLPAHVGVMIDDARVMQITQDHGCTITKLARHKKNIHSVYRHRKFA